MVNWKQSNDGLAAKEPNLQRDHISRHETATGKRGGDSQRVDELLGKLEAASIRLADEAKGLARRFEEASTLVHRLTQQRGTDGRKLELASELGNLEATGPQPRATPLNKTGKYPPSQEKGGVEERKLRRAILMNLREIGASHPIDRTEKRTLSEARRLFVPGRTTASEPDSRNRVRRKVRLQNVGAPYVGYGLGRPRISILAWDVCHNPLGRAHLLAEALQVDYNVEIVGAAFPAFGGRPWKPLRESKIPIKWFRASHFPDFMGQIESVAGQIDGDLILVSKPRLPSFLLGIEAKACRNRPLVLDIDDYEIGFVDGLNARKPNQDQLAQDFHTPYGELWTRYCETLVEHADEITVSSDQLQKKYGGTIIPHMRDEHVFQPQLFDRDAIRRSFGYAPDDYIILFIGTPRVHKGIVEIAAALEALNNPKYRLCIVGAIDDSDLRDTLRYSFPHANIDLLPERSFHELPRNLCAGDLVCILQDAGSIVSRYQVPAKLTDALAMGIPVLATEVPPLADLVRRGVVQVAGAQPLSAKIDEIFRNYVFYKKCAEQNREIFVQEYSYAANRSKLRGVIDGLLSAPPSPIPKEFIGFRRFGQRTFRDVAFEGNAPASERYRMPQILAGTGLRIPSWEARPEAPMDIIFFWKQNDSGIYGRRQDMLVRHLARDPCVRTIIHFEPPMSLWKLLSMLDLRKGRRRRHNRYIFWQTLRRLLRLNDTKKVKYRTFVHARASKRRSRLRWTLLSSRTNYPRYVGKQMRKLGADAGSALFWVCPIDFEFASLVAQFNPPFVVADLIDDHRTWPVSAAFRQRIQRNYEEILNLSDLVLANNANLKQSMSSIRNDIHVVPNGVDTDLQGANRRRRPKALKRLKGPIIGYIGNLDSRRLDTALIERLATRHPQWHIVLIGSTHADDGILSLDRLPNVHLLGVIPYKKAMAYVRSFDVAIIPHLDNKLTKHMNPLKLFVYFSLGLPIVTTNIQNMGELKDHVLISRSNAEFERNVEQSLSRSQTNNTKSRAHMIRKESWEFRVQTILSLVRSVSHHPPSAPRPGNERLI